MLYEEFLAKVEKVEHEPVVKRRVQYTSTDGHYSRYGVVSIREGACRDVLNGNVDSLLLAFNWGSTPQGSEYWVNRKRGHAVMSEEDYEFVRGLIA